MKTRVGAAPCVPATAGGPAGLPPGPSGAVFVEHPGGKGALDQRRALLAGPYLGGDGAGPAPAPGPPRPAGGSRRGWRGSGRGSSGGERRSCCCSCCCCCQCCCCWRGRTRRSSRRPASAGCCGLARPSSRGPGDPGAPAASPGRPQALPAGDRQHQRSGDPGAGGPPGQPGAHADAVPRPHGQALCREVGAQKEG
jgi:hypothetical protein